MNRVMTKTIAHRIKIIIKKRGKAKMKDKIHPKYEDAAFTCSCGNVIKTRATIGSTHIDICNECHPFYTGKQKLIDSAGRVDRFRKRYQNVTAAQAK